MTTATAQRVYADRDGDLWGELPGDMLAPLSGPLSGPLFWVFPGEVRRVFVEESFGPLSEVEL